MPPLPVAALAAAACLAALPAAAQWQFTDVSTAAGVDRSHGNPNYVTPEERMAGGLACGDYDNDGWPDLYHLGGALGVNSLLRNNGDGTFTDVAAAAGVAVPFHMGMGATFCDWNGDGWLDLFVGGVEGDRFKMFESNGDGTFRQVADSSGVVLSTDTYGPSFADIDNDGDLDFAVAHWGQNEAAGHFWRNDGNGSFSARFVSVDSLIGYTGYSSPPVDYSFAYNFADLDDDGWTDFVVASDFGTSHVFLNDGDGTFTETTDDSVVTDDNGMGTTVADYDNDGDLDWFVTSIHDSAAGYPTGNRLYRNEGGGAFADVTDAAGVRSGLFGWGATFQDFNNDGWLDIAHVNGWYGGLPQWLFNPARLFVSNGDGTFTNQATALGADHTGQGRGIAAFDYDRDGDLDLAISNLGQPAALLRNDGVTNHWLRVKLTGPAPNTEQIGARIHATAGGLTQMRELRCGNNFNSHDPVVAHFGLGAATTADVLTVSWPDGGTTTLVDVPADQFLTIDRGAVVSAPDVRPRPAAGVVLRGVAPNPLLRGTARIDFDLERGGRATVRVHDTAGRLVRTLLDGSRPAGRHTVAWDGRDAQGRPAAAGVYHLEIRTARGRAEGRVTVLR